jgi:NAD(P)-dependent dehydrogenase (short-subunit alcohol dehydrogenase family)
VRFAGHAAVVTGAGSGLGREYALALAARGASVVCNDVAGDAAEATARAIRDAGGTAVPEASSVATPDGGDAIVQAAIDAFGSVEIVVNNAGQLRNAAFGALSVGDVQDVLATHLGGAFYVTQPAYRHMQEAGYGRIVFTSSSAGMFGSPWQANYAAAKAGIVGLCRTVALEGAAYGILANAVLPKAITGIGDPDRPAFPPDLMRETVAALRPLVPSMTVENVAPLVVHLASRECTHTGQLFSVGCGHVARVFVGQAPGWYASEPEGMTPEAVAAHLDEAAELDGFAVPESMRDEVRAVVAHRP